MGSAAPISLPTAALDGLMPLHVVAGRGGRIRHVGPTLAKIHPGRRLVGERFFDVFEMRRGCADGSECALSALLGTKVRLRLRDGERTQLIGCVAPLAGEEAVLVNLSFGISVVDAVSRFDLTGSDFAPTDLAVELLYLFEAKSAVMAESRELNERLNGARAEAEAVALADTLTGLANRRALDRALKRNLQRDTRFALMHLDLDFFKAVNDTLGHAAGDEVLRQVAHILRDETRENDLVARVGGDEFILLFNELTDSVRLSAIAERVIRRIEAPISCASGSARVSASIGMVTSTTYDRPDIARMMNDADIALYVSKRAGRARHTVFTPALGAATSAADVAEARARAEH